MPYFTIRRHILVMAARLHSKYNQLIYKQLHTKEQNMMFFVCFAGKRQSAVCDGQENVKSAPETGVNICLEGI